jgi:ankyrin repeat protein
VWQTLSLAFTAFKKNLVTQRALDYTELRLNRQPTVRVKGWSHLPPAKNPGGLADPFIARIRGQRALSEGVVMKRALPPDPSLEFDRKQAKELLAALRAGDTEALNRFTAHHPDFKPAAPSVETVGLHDAQLVIAREYGLPSWRALVEKIEESELNRFRKALQKGDVDAARRLLKNCESLRRKINDPILAFGRRAVHGASNNPALMDVLIEFGADINLRSDWENGPFSVLDDCPDHVARQLIARGAKLTPHAASRLGWIDELRAMLDADPKVVHEKGGDGQRPLHFAKTIEIVDLLLERGAHIDARCDDHHSTAAQYALNQRPEICRHLLARGATPDIFMAARLGDDALANRLIDADESCLNARVNWPGYPLVVQFNIYCWDLGWSLSPHEVAMNFRQRATFELLLRRSDPKSRFLVACSSGDEPAARSELAGNPKMIEQLSAQEHSLLTASMFYDRSPAVRLMLALGFDPMTRGVEGGTLMHVACWVGNADIVELLLRDYRDRIDLNARDPQHNGTPLGWAIHGSVHCGRENGQHAGVVELLLGAGVTPVDPSEAGSDSVRAVLKRHGVGAAQST